MKFLLPLVLFSCCFFLLAADTNGDTGVYGPMHASPIIIAGRNNLDLADEKWERFSSEIDWFLERNDKLLKEYEQQLKAAGDWDDEVRRSKKLSDAIFETLESFHHLRKKTINAVSTKWGDSSHGFLMYTRAFLDLTEMYIACFKKMFFPQDWDSLYNDHLKQKQSSLP